MKKIKLGIYFGHYECLGHTSRAMALADVFKRKFPEGEVFFVQAGMDQPAAKTGTLGPVYALPGTLMNRGYFRQEPGVHADIEARSAACLNIINREKPDIFVTEFFPFGLQECRHELAQALMMARALGAKLWAVAGYPLMPPAGGWQDKIFKLYERFIFLCPPREKDYMSTSSGFFERHASRITFGGYLLSSRPVVHDDEDENIPKPPKPQGAVSVTVVRGSGAVYPKVIAEAIVASDLLGKGYYLTVVAGPSTTKKEWFFFSTLVKKKKIHNVVLLRSAGNYEKLIGSADLCVSLSGYHTSVMLMKHRKKCVIIPFEGYIPGSFAEQPARARMLKETIGAVVLSMDELTAENLAAAVKELAASTIPVMALPEEWFSGEKFLSQSLTGLFQP